MPDVIVIGAGVVGAATAYALTEVGAQVVVIDGGQVTAGTSAVSFAVDITRVKTPRTLFDLSLASAREHASHQRSWPSSRWVHPAATLEWERTERDRVRVRERLRRLHTWEYPAQWMSSQPLRDIEPSLAMPTGDTAEERLDLFRPTRFYSGDEERDVLDDSTRTMLSRINSLNPQESSDVV